jgi:hypothetical protein
MEKAAPPPPPPSPPMVVTAWNKSVRLAHDHPYWAGGLALAMTAGLGYGGYTAYTYGGLRGSSNRGKRLGSKGVVQDGMLKEAVGKLPACSVKAKLTISSAGPLPHATALGAPGSNSA